MKFKLLFHDLNNEWKDMISEKVFETYDELLKHISDEHFANGLSRFLVILPSDDDGLFPEFDEKYFKAAL